MNASAISEAAKRRLGPVALMVLAVPGFLSAQCETAKLLPQAGNDKFRFGQCVAVDGKWAVFGAEGGSRAIVVKETDGQWLEVQQLMPSYPESVDVASDWIVLGMPGTEVGNVVDAGAVDIYRLEGHSWVKKQRILASDPASGDFFGWSVALSPPLLVVGAPRADVLGGPPNAGAAYVFEFDIGASTWLQSTKLTAADAEAFALMGEAVAVGAATIVVGCPEKTEGQYNAGAAYVFERVNGTWSEAAKLVGDGHLSEVFSRGAVGIARDVIMVGAYANNVTPALKGSGAVFVFDRRLSGWVKSQKIVAADAKKLGAFGHSLAVSEQDVVIGSLRGELPHIGSIGAVYHFRRMGDQWQQVGKAIANDGESVWLGYDVDLWKDSVMAGARWDTAQCPSVICDSGSVYVFQLGVDAVQFCSCLTGGPCGNDDSHGGCCNSTFHGGVLQSCGSGNATKDDLRMESRWLPTSQTAITFMGSSAQRLPFGDGQLCVGPGNTGVFRFAPQDSGSEGVITLGPGIVAYSHANFPPAGQIQPGQAWYFQTWYRDPAGPCGMGFNLTNGLKVDFKP